MRDASNDNTADKSQTITVSSEIFSGPVPPPEILAEYKSIDPNIPDRIITMAENQQAHTHELEKYAMKSAVKTESKGQTYALIVSLTIILGSMFLIYDGKEISGGILAGSTLIGLAYVFITGRKKDRQNDE